ncbi:hypothetical protein F2Q68_00025694 [Brassica cretica]|uniref:Uncharacterized protein n=1 Tax=Brassica cretica TaxID=69181 RepID=A0A8S9IAV9_BRACR|nr:hypothetical protein F2Q68_00025694 [Brassica cretica]
MTPSTSYKRGSPLRVQPQERQQAKPYQSRTPPPPLATAAPPPPKPAAAHRPRSPSRCTRAPSRRLLDSASCKQLRSEPQGKTGISSSMSLGMTDPKPSSLL